MFNNSDRETLEKNILKAYMAAIKKVGNRGPSNIYVKIQDNTIQIYFNLLKSPLEIFIYQNFEDSNAYLTDLYWRINQVVLPEFLTELEALIDLEIKFSDFSIDVDKDRFCLILEYSCKNPVRMDVLK